MKLKNIARILVFGFSPTLAIAQQTEAPTENPPRAAKIEQAVPKLNIVWSCGNCEQNEKVIPLIEEAYRSEATKNGKIISETESADATITTYRQRPPGKRVMMGVFAGKDTLELKINYKGSESLASDYSANVLQGMNHLCESIGKLAYKNISKQ